MPLDPEELKRMFDDEMETDDEILRKRAMVIAKPIAGRQAAEDTRTLLEFVTMGHRYAVPLSQVTAVTRIAEITAIPLVPDHISGVIRRRGESIALVNLMRFFNAASTGISDADFAVIVRGGQKQFALQVDDVRGVTLIPEAALRPPQENFNPAEQPFISQVSLDGLMVLDLDSLVTAKGFVAEKSIG